MYRRAARIALAGMLFLAPVAPAGAGGYEQARDEAYFDAMVRSGIRGDIGTCELIGLEAALIMKKRQSGVAMSSLMEGYEGMSMFGRFVIRDAYNQTAMRSERGKQESIVDFRNRYESECYSIVP